MERIDLKTGFLCNNNCRFCVQAHKKQFGNKTTEELKEHLRASVSKFKEVVLTGGESTVRADILELVRFARKIGYTAIQLQTNGRMFAYKDFCKKMADAGANEFAIAIHGNTPQLHDYLTGAPGSFKQTLQGIKNLVSMDQLVLTNTVITKPNYPYLPDVARLLIDARVRRIQFAFVHIMGNAARNSLSVVPRKSLVEPFVKKAIDVGRLANARMTTEAIPYCFMDGYEESVTEKNIPKTKVFDLDYVIEDFTAVRRDEGKTKRKECRSCYFDKVCEGPWKEYPELYGWEEFHPVLNGKNRNAKRRTDRKSPLKSPLI